MQAGKARSYSGICTHAHYTQIAIVFLDNGVFNPIRLRKIDHHTSQLQLGTITDMSSLCQTIYINNYSPSIFFTLLHCMLFIIYK